MDICCNDVFFMPSSYVVMDENEMCYTEGGAQISSMTKSQCIDALTMAGISSPEIVLAGALTFTLAKTLVAKLALAGGIASVVVEAILAWGAGQIVELGYAVARGALNNGVDIYWNWNPLTGDIGVGYNLR